MKLIIIKTQLASVNAYQFGLIFLYGETIRKYLSYVRSEYFVEFVKFVRSEREQQPATISWRDVFRPCNMQRTHATPVTLGIANTRMHKNPEKCIESAWNASKYCARDLSRLARFAVHVHTSVHFVWQEVEDL